MPKNSPSEIAPKTVSLRANLLQPQVYSELISDCEILVQSRQDEYAYTIE